MTDNRLHRAPPDSVAQWLQATGTTDATDKSAALHPAYCAWCKAQGLAGVSLSLFGLELFKAGVVQVEPPKERSDRTRKGKSKSKTEPTQEIGQ